MSNGINNTERPKAVWLSTKYETTISQDVFAKVSQKGFIGLYQVNPDGTERYQCGFGPDFGAMILGHSHEAVAKAADLQNNNKQDRKIAKQASQELLKMAMQDKNLLEQIKALTAKKIS